MPRVRRVHLPKADRLRPDRRVLLRQVLALPQAHRVLRQARPDRKVHRPGKVCLVPGHSPDRRQPERLVLRDRRVLPLGLSRDRVCRAACPEA